MHTEDDVKALAARFGTTEVYCRNLKKQVPLDIITDYVSIFTLARVALEDGDKIRLPRELVASIHAELRGIIIGKKLEPEQCGYRCQIYDHAETLKEYLEEPK